MNKKGFFPCVWIQFLGDKVLATAGMRLEALLDAEILKKELPGEEQAVMQGQLDPLTQILWEASEQLVQNLVAWGEETFVELHWTSWPNLAFPARGKLDITLTLNSLSSTEEQAREKVLARYLPFRGILISHLPWAVFAPIHDEDELRDRIESFKPRNCLALMRRSQQVPLSLPLPVTAAQIGFIQKTESDDEAPRSNGAWVDHLFPWVPSFDPLHRLIDFLLWYPEPVSLNVRLRPHPRGEREDDFLIQTIRKCEELLSGPLRSDESILASQAVALKEFSLQRLTELSQARLRLSAYVASQGHLDEALMQTLATSFIGDDREEGSKRLLKGGVSLKRVAPERMKDPDFWPDGHDFTFSEAACLFRLPWPPQADLRGFKLKRWRSTFAYLPEKCLQNNHGVILGQNIHRGIAQPIKVSLEDRMRHMFIVGQTGTGKSTLMESLILQDIHAGRGLCLIDPHGELVEEILQQYPPKRLEDLILIDLTDHSYPFALNLLAWKNPEERDRIIDELYTSLDRMYDMNVAGGPIFEKHFRGMLRLLMGEGKRKFVPTLLELPLLYTDKGFRKFCLKGIDDEQIHQFLDEAEEIRGDSSIENISIYVTSKIARFTQDTRLRRIFGQEGLSLDFAWAMDKGKVVLINLGQGLFGETVSSLVASQLVGRFKAAAMARAKIALEKRRDFFLYVDEFQNLAHENFVDMLSEARKYRMGLILANQYTEQLQQNWVGRRDSMLSSILGNIGMTIAFRLGVEDAQRLAGVFSPTFSAHDLMELPNWEAYLKMHLGQTNIQAFNIRTIKSTGSRDPENVARLRKWNQQRYCNPAQKVDEEIQIRWSQIRKLGS